MLHVHVFHHSPASRAKAPHLAASDLAEFLGLITHALNEFVIVPRVEASETCLNVASIELVNLGSLLSRGVAEALVSAWLDYFPDDTSFLTNGDAARGPSLGTGVVPPLFGHDLEAGILAVSNTKSGLFWNAENA